MKVWVWWVSLMAASLTSAWGQVTVEVTQDQQSFLQGEALPVTVRVTNRSGQTLHLGAGNDWLTFFIEGRDSKVVPKIGEAPVAGEFDLETSKAAVKTVDLEPWFVLNQPGHYAITAMVHIKQWNQDLPSRPVSFDIVEAAKIWEQPVGLLESVDNTNRVPVVHKYVLQQATYIRGQVRLYLRVTDAFDKLLRLVPVGPMLTFSRPDPRIDRSSNLHLLYQNGPHSFSYSEFNPSGEVLARHTYDFLGTRPHFRTDEMGEISVVGGTRRVTPDDVPRPPSDDAPAASQTPGGPPAQTNSAAKP